MKNKILQEFKNSNIKIKSKETLIKYIDLCLDNNQEYRIKGKSSLHHILPKALFDKFSNLKETPWNGLILCIPTTTKHISCLPRP